MSRWQEKRAREAEYQLEKELQSSGNGVDEEALKSKDTRGAAMGDGDEELFEKKLTKEEKKALAKAKREAKKKMKKGNTGGEEEEEKKSAVNVNEILKDATATEEKGIDDDGLDHTQADALAAEGTICTFSSSRKGVDARSRDVNVQNFTRKFIMLRAHWREYLCWIRVSLVVILACQPSFHSFCSSTQGCSNVG